MNTIERLRPEIRPLDAGWSANTLEGILSSEGPSKVPARARGRRRLALVGAATAGALGIGGVAYATGVVPGFIADELDWVSPTTVSHVHEVASFSFQTNGKTRSFVIWRGTNASGNNCTAVLEAKSTVGPEFGANCLNHPTDAWFDRTSESYRGDINDTPPPGTYFVYGEPPMSGVVSVRVFGDRFDHTVQIDRATNGFATAIPELTGTQPSGHFATVEFLATDGTVLGTRGLFEK
jgi:hypothetical protein